MSSSKVSMYAAGSGVDVTHRWDRPQRTEFMVEGEHKLDHSNRVGVQG
jgi:hypothetical protein